MRRRTSPAGETATRSVNVPPVSTPMRQPPSPVHRAVAPPGAGSVATASGVEVLRPATAVCSKVAMASASVVRSAKPATSMGAPATAGIDDDDPVGQLVDLGHLGAVRRAPRCPALRSRAGCDRSPPCCRHPRRASAPRARAGPVAARWQPRWRPSAGCRPTAMGSGARADSRADAEALRRARPPAAAGGRGLRNRPRRPISRPPGASRGSRPPRGWRTACPAGRLAGMPCAHPRPCPRDAPSSRSSPSVADEASRGGDDLPGAGTLDADEARTSPRRDEQSPRPGIHASSRTSQLADRTASDALVDLGASPSGVVGSSSDATGPSTHGLVAHHELPCDAAPRSAPAPSAPPPRPRRG